ncbi:MAG: NAD(P)-binding domain-containing protein [Actinomycetota bacterium]
MRIAVLGTGTVGSTIGSKLVSLGHDVVMGSRTADNPKAAAWIATCLTDAAATGGTAGAAAYADAAAGAELIVNATAGTGSLDALRAAGAVNLAGKVLLDISNPLDFSRGMPPSLSVSNTDSLGEQIQREFPDASVVKSLNTMTAAVMTNPSTVAGAHSVFVSGEDANAKGEVRNLLISFGWPPDRIIDLGGIVSARGVEMYLPLWLNLMAALGTPMFNIAVARA